MRIVATADLHGALPEPGKSPLEGGIPECDLLLIAGDVCPVNDSHEPKVQRSWIRKTFFPWLESLPAEHIIWIAGNHDFVAEQPGFYRIADEGPKNAKYLNDNHALIDGLNIYGSPWTPNLRNWAFYKEDAAWEDYANNLPPADIYLLHSPPAGILCENHPEWGSPFIYKAIRKHMPKQVIFGHIHEGYGREEIGSTIFRNVAHMNIAYEPVNPLQTFIL